MKCHHCSEDIGCTLEAYPECKIRFDCVCEECWVNNMTDIAIRDDEWIAKVLYRIQSKCNPHKLEKVELMLTLRKI